MADYTPYYMRKAEEELAQPGSGFHPERAQTHATLAVADAIERNTRVIGYLLEQSAAKDLGGLPMADPYESMLERIVAIADPVYVTSVHRGTTGRIEYITVRLGNGDVCRIERSS